jgi:uncharacterized protein
VAVTNRFYTWVVIAMGVVLVGVVLVYQAARHRTPPPISEPAAVLNLEETKGKAEHGDAEAQKLLGSVFAKGQGVKQSYSAAAHWYRLAAEQGHAGAQAALAELYEAGQGVPFDAAEAAKWYRRAAEQGHVGAQYCLAVLCVMGKGVPRNVAEALKWYQRAAEQGDALAQYNLGMRHKEGDGLPLDPPEAYKWLSLAAAQNIPDAAKALDELKRTLTREQMNEGRRRAEAFVPAKRAPAAR